LGGYDDFYYFWGGKTGNKTDFVFSIQPDRKKFP
jgi:hypothetical protein